MKKRTKNKELRDRVKELEERLKKSQKMNDEFQIAFMTTVAHVYEALEKYIDLSHCANSYKDFPFLLKEAFLTAEANERKECIRQMRLLAVTYPPNQGLQKVIAQLEAGPWLKKGT